MGNVRFAAEQCRTVELVDAETGTTVVGAEDLSLSSNTLWVSAYDRLANAEGGVYDIQLADLGGDEVSVTPFLADIRPHGISGGEGYVDAIVRDGVGNVSLLKALRTPTRILTLKTSDLPCGANDLVQGWEETAYTVDRDTCQGAFHERVLGKPSARVEHLLGVAKTRSVLLDGLKLANGIAEYGDQLWIAEMRAKRLINLDRETIDLPGAPDNLNASSEGIVAALQPQLWRFGLYRYGHSERAPTRIALIDPVTEEIEILYDDPKGTLLSGATAAVLTDDGTMIASSVRGDRLLVCEPSP
ncbi:hypothetical protein [Parvularcula lutaonensis]|uniref:Uncharacterized protein n=1 Tax=Parvularcula lutaonensis TaxID=491923 RepID=A0ABV7M9A3_9PROT|nr:hypothetical protein [Parvularcula lutaonensis]